MWFGSNLILAHRDQIFRPTNHTCRGPTDLEMRNLAHRLKLEHEVEGRHLQNSDIRHAQHVSDCFQGRARQPTFLLLRTPQQWYHSTGLTAFRKFSFLRLRPGQIGGRKGKGGGLV